jgi:hypothetical protein
MTTRNLEVKTVIDLRLRPSLGDGTPLAEGAVFCAIFVSGNKYAERPKNDSPRRCSAMRRTVWGAMLPLAAGLVGGICSQPVAVAAQKLAAHLKAESVTAEFMRIVGAATLDAGQDRIQLATQWGGQGADIRLLGPDGQTRRVVISSGGIDVPDADGAGMNVYNQNGVTVARLGMGRGPLGNQPLANVLFLSDQDGHRRILLSVDQSGTPSIKLLDAKGNVTWSTP